MLEENPTEENGFSDRQNSAAFIPPLTRFKLSYRRDSDETELDALGSEFRDRFGQLPEMVQNLLYQMRVKLRAEKAGLSSVNWEAGQILLKYPAPAEGAEPKRLLDLGEGIRGGKSAYWVTVAKDEAWTIRLLDVLDRLLKSPAF